MSLWGTSPETVLFFNRVSLPTAGRPLGEVPSNRKKGRFMTVIAILTIVALVLLVLHWRGPNAVWGGATLGIMVGLIVALLAKDWSRLALIFSVGIFVGTLFEWIGRIASRRGS